MTLFAVANAVHYSGRVAHHTATQSANATLLAVEGVVVMGTLAYYAVKTLIKVGRVAKNAIQYLIGEPKPIALSEEEFVIVRKEDVPAIITCYPVPGSQRKLVVSWINPSNMS